MKLFVANIESRITEAELLTIFSTCGEVSSVKIITDRATGIPKGFAFIDMPNEADAQQAINRVHEKEVNGRKLSVAQAKPKSSPF